MRLSDADLEALLVSPESDRVEREASFRGEAPDTVRQAVRDCYANFERLARRLSRHLDVSVPELTDQAS